MTFKMYILLLVNLLGISPASHAVSVHKRENAVIEGTSEHRRLDKKYAAAYQLFGLNSTALPGSALHFGYYLNRNELLQLELTRGFGSLRWLDLFAESKLEAASVGLHYKNFLGNSFFIKAGADLRTAKYNYRYDGLMLTGAVKKERSLSGVSFAPAITIGNQWQWDHFLLGIDWIGYSHALISKVQSESISADATDYDRQEFREEKARMIDGGLSHGFRLFMGASF